MSFEGMMEIIKVWEEVKKKKLPFLTAFPLVVPYGFQISNFWDDFERIRNLMNSNK